MSNMSTFINIFFQLQDHASMLLLVNFAPDGPSGSSMVTLFNVTYFLEIIWVLDDKKRMLLQCTDLVILLPFECIGLFLFHFLIR